MRAPAAPSDVTDDFEIAEVSSVGGTAGAAAWTETTGITKDPPAPYQVAGAGDVGALLSDVALTR